MVCKLENLIKQIEKLDEPKKLELERNLIKEIKIKEITKTLDQNTLYTYISLLGKVGSLTSLHFFSNLLAQINENGYNFSFNQKHNLIYILTIAIEEIGYRHKELKNKANRLLDKVLKTLDNLYKSI